MNESYPSHIYEPNRVALAREVLQKELRKLLLGLPTDSWKLIDKSVVGWATEPAKYHLETEKLRDFWDIFAAVMESIKLKSTFTAMFTAKNMHWTKKTLSVRKIQMTSPLGQLQQVPGLDLRSDLPFAELIDVLANNPGIIKQHRKIADKHGKDPAQDEFRIIVRKTKKGLYRRTLKAVLYGKPTIKAWVGELDGDKLRDFWIPVNDMFQLVRVFKYARSHKDKNTMRATARVLGHHFMVSTVAEVTYKARIGNQNEAAKQLYDLAKQIQA